METLRNFGFGYDVIIRPSVGKPLVRLTFFIIHQTHYEKSDWSRAFNQFTIACELDMINVISAADITFNVCLVTKPLGVFSSETKWLNASLLFLRMNYVKNV